MRVVMVLHCLRLRGRRWLTATNAGPGWQHLQFAILWRGRIKAGEEAQRSPLRFFFSRETEALHTEERNIVNAIIKHVTRPTEPGRHIFGSKGDKSVEINLSGHSGLSQRATNLYSVGMY
jgi:hypothetical protein